MAACRKLGGRVEAAEHVHEHLPVAGRLGVDDAAGVGHGGGQRQLTQHVLAGLKRAQDVFGVQPGGQADVDQVDSGIVVDAGHLRGGGVAELVGEGVQLGRGPAEDHHLADLGMGVVDAGVGDPEAGAQQADLHGALRGELGPGGWEASSPRQPTTTPAWFGPGDQLVAPGALAAQCAVAILQAARRATCRHVSFMGW
jgi:hypothetical protein